MTDDLPDTEIIAIEIGRRDKLGRAEAKSMASAFHRARARHPEVPILISVGGYDEDPRELWDIPEVCRFIKEWAGLCGLVTPESAALHALPVTAREISDERWAEMMIRSRVKFIGLLGACGCWDRLRNSRVRAPSRKET